MGANNSQWQLCIRKADLSETRDDDTKQERFVRTEINFSLGKNGGCMLSSLGGRLISVDRQ